MAPKIFITGVTGYIGGDALYALYNAHPEYEYSALIRTKHKAENVQKQYPKLRPVIGGLDDSKLLEEEAAKADVVIHTADSSDHEGAARAIAAGLSKHSASQPGYWLHTGGTGILCWYDMKHNNLGIHSDKEYNDWSGVSELVNLPDEAFHRNVDKIVLQETGLRAELKDKVKTAVLCPPTIYGWGRGPEHQRSRQAYELAKFILTKQSVPIIGEGKARWNNVHVHDLAQLFVLLTEAAVANKNDPELWGEKGYYLVENGEHVWSELARKMGKRAVELGLIKAPKEDALGKDEAMKQAGFEAVSWGLNSRGKAERARKTVGWTPKEKSIEEEIDRILNDEKQRLG